MSWSCNWRDEYIEIYYGANLKGNYTLLEDPYCEVCARPDVTTADCNEHSYLNSVDRIYAMGCYIPYRRRTGPHLLSSHILRAKNDSSFIAPLGMSMVITARNRYPDVMEYEFIVPVPLHSDKLTRRGYNQALQLSMIIGCELEIDLLECLEKTQNVDFQGRGWSGRSRLIEDLYRIKPQFVREVVDKRIIIIDDVVTTGLTVNKCAEILKNSGALAVCAFTAARTRGD